ncbi:MAG: DUF4177 domain-containing protein [Pseudomonadota bacterium]
MSAWEYKVIPAPTKGVKARGVKGAEGRFAHALEAVMNDLAAEGWEFQRAETLPSTERSGLTGSTTEWRNMLVFRRAVAVPAIPADQPTPELLPPPTPEPKETGPTRADIADETTADDAHPTPEDTADAPESLKSLEEEKPDDRPTA